MRRQRVARDEQGQAGNGGDLSQAEVQAILGPPTESESVDVTVFSGTSSTWKWQGTTITIQFVNGKVIAKQLTQGGKPSP